MSSIGRQETDRLWVPNGKKRLFSQRRTSEENIVAACLKTKFHNFPIVV